MIADEWEGQLYAAIQQAAGHVGSEVVAIGGVADHVHVLATPPTTLGVIGIDLTDWQRPPKAEVIVTYLFRTRYRYQLEGAIIPSAECEYSARYQGGVAPPRPLLITEGNRHTR